MKILKIGLRTLLALFMLMAGVGHMVNPGQFVRIMPPYIPFPLAMVYISGFFEILGGLGLLIPRLRKKAAWGLVALYVAVFPANLHMALHHIPFGDGPTPDWLLWLRLPLQAVLIGLAYWFTKADE